MGYVACKKENEGNENLHKFSDVLRELMSSSLCFPRRSVDARWKKYLVQVFKLFFLQCSNGEFINKDYIGPKAGLADWLAG